MSKFLALGLCAHLLSAAPASAQAQFAAPAWVRIPTSELGKYQTLWAMSDIHGSLAILQNLFSRAGLITKSADGYAWSSGVSGRGHLVVPVGDYLNGGPDSVPVVLFLKQLQPQAIQANSRLVVLLGNQEVELLSDPEKN